VGDLLFKSLWHKAAEAICCSVQSFTLHMQGCSLRPQDWGTRESYQHLMSYCTPGGPRQDLCMGLARSKCKMNRVS